MAHLCFEGPRKQAVDIMVAIVGKDEAAVADIFIKIGALEGIELHKFVAADITKWILKNVVAIEVDDFFLEVNGYGRVFDERIEEVGGHSLVGVPIP